MAENGHPDRPFAAAQANEPGLREESGERTEAEGLRPGEKDGERPEAEGLPPGEKNGEQIPQPEENGAEDYGYLDSVRKGTGERAGPLYRCLMVTTGQEQQVKQLLDALELGESVIPKAIRLRRGSSAGEGDRRLFLPGYIFVHEEQEVPLWKYQQLLNVIRVLRYDQEPYGYMKNEDLIFARTFFEMDGCIQPLQAIDEGDFIRITDGLLKNINGTVLSVDRHKRQAKIRIRLMGMEKVVYMNYTLLEKVEEPGDGKAPEAEKAAGRPRERRGASEGGASE
ncbi:MAG: hypothetical protein K5922_04265 [Clostridiales bacterium]|nr:hypothetical protein [Clostridiales bacterium]